MSIIFDTSLTDDVTHDESAGLQNASLPVGSSAGDLDDDDILPSSISTLLTTLAGLGAPATAIGAARNQVLTFVEGANPALKFRLFDGADSDGADPLLDSELTTLTTTAGDDPITLVRINDTTIFGYANYGETGERVAFALVLQPIAPTATVPGGANILIIQYEAINHPDTDDPDDALDLSGLVFVDAVQDVAFDDFSDAAAGNNLWNLVTDTATQIQLLFTGFERGTDTVNTSSFGIGSNAQSIGDTDGIIVDFVRGQTTPTQTSADDLANIDFNERVEGPTGGFTLVQVGGGPTNRVNATVVAYDSDEVGKLPPPPDGGTPTDDYTDGSIDGTPKTIISINVWLVSDDPNVADVLVRTWLRDGNQTSGSDSGVSFAIDGDGVKIIGLLDNYRVEFAVDGLLDRFSVQNTTGSGGNKTFDIGDIRLGGLEGDTAEVGSHINFEDAGPDAVANLAADTLVLDETRPVGTDHGGDSDPAGLATVSANFADNFATPPDFGTDGAGSVSYALQLTGSNVASGLYAVDPTDTTAGDGDPVGRGESIVLNKVGNAIVGTGASNGLTYFTISVDNNPLSANFGYVTFSQDRNVWHASTASDDDTSTLTLANANLLRLEQTVTDAEGDSDTAAINLGTGVFQIEDAGPLDLQPVNTSVENAVGESATAALDDGSPTPFSANFGSDGAGGLRFTGLNDDAGPWVDGASLQDANGNLLTSNSQQIKLSGFGTSVLTAYVGTDPEATGAKVFTMTLNSAGTYTITMFAKIDDGSFDFDNFATAGAGNFTWVGVSGDEFPNKDLLVTGGNAGVHKVNNDSDDLAIGDQWIDAAETTPQGVFIPAEIIRIDFVNLGIAANTGGKTLATIDDILSPVTHYDVNNVGFTIMQTQAGNPVDVRITAIDAGGDIGGTDIADDLATGTIEDILSVKIITNSLTAPEGTTYLRSAATEEDVGGVTRLVTRDDDTDALLILWDDNVDAVSAFDGSVIVYNLEGANSNQSLLRDRVFVGTDNTGFDRLEISNAEAVNSGHSFAIGDVEVGAAGEDVSLEFNAQIVDAEGDADSIGLIGVTVTPETVV